MYSTDAMAVAAGHAYSLHRLYNGEIVAAATEIHANAENGYGIFTVADCDTMQVYVTPSSGMGR